ncbi:unnamed protein product [Sphagnum tenellum]
MLELTADQWAKRLNANWAVTNGSLVPSTASPPPLTLQQLAQQAMSAGLQIVSNTDTNLNGVYDVQATTQNHIQAEVVSILLSGGTFADGSNTIIWPDMVSINHTFDVPHFQSFAKVVGAYVSTLYKVMNNSVTTLPPNGANIL